MSKRRLILVATVCAAVGLIWFQVAQGQNGRARPAPQQNWADDELAQADRQPPGDQPDDPPPGPPGGGDDRRPPPGPQGDDDHRPPMGPPGMGPGFPPPGGPPGMGGERNPPPGRPGMGPGGPQGPGREGDRRGPPPGERGRGGPEQGRQAGPGMPGMREHLAMLEKSDPEMYKLVKADMDLERQSRELAMQYRRASSDEQAKLKDKIKEVVAKHFDVRQERRALDLKRLETQLQKLRESIERRKQARDKLVDQRVSELVGHEEEMGF
jgi:hypothetical protein